RWRWRQKLSNTAKGPGSTRPESPGLRMAAGSATTERPLGREAEGTGGAWYRPVPGLSSRAAGPAPSARARRRAPPEEEPALAPPAQKGSAPILGRGWGRFVANRKRISSDR